MAKNRRTVGVALGTSGVDELGRPKRSPLTVNESGAVTTLEPPPALEPELEGEHLLINIGPQHPATHGVLVELIEAPGGPAWAALGYEGA